MALIVYDMQIGILYQLKDGAEIVGARSLCRTGGASGRPAHHFHATHVLPQKLMGAFQFRMAMAWQHVEDPNAVKPWFLRDSPGFGIVPELTPRADEAIFDKITM